MRVVVISGYFNPLHCGHLDYIESAAQLGDRLVVIVNNDEQVSLKGSRPFMNEKDRARIVSSLSHVDQVFLSSDSDKTVVETLKRIYGVYRNEYFIEDMSFANGGDRNENNSPEEEYCVSEGILTAYSVGGEKVQSSSTILQKCASVTKNGWYNNKDG